MEDIQLFDEKLNAGGDQIIGQIVAVYLDNGGHYQEIPTGVENISKGKSKNK